MKRTASELLRFFKKTRTQEEEVCMQEESPSSNSYPPVLQTGVTAQLPNPSLPNEKISLLLLGDSKHVSALRYFYKQLHPNAGSNDSSLDYVSYNYNNRVFPIWNLNYVNRISDRMSITNRFTTHTDRVFILLFTDDKAWMKEQLEQLNLSCFPRQQLFLVINAGEIAHIAWAQSAQLSIIVNNFTVAGPGCAYNVNAIFNSIIAKKEELSQVTTLGEELDESCPMEVDEAVPLHTPT